MKKEKVCHIILYILILIAILSIILPKELDNLDEAWNYNFARNVADGLVPYRDFSMLQMPLLPMLCSIALKISNQLIVMRVLAAALCAGVIFVIYKLFNLLEVKKNISLIFCFLIGYLLKDSYCIDYNWATLLITLFIIYLEIKVYQKDKIFLKADIKNDILLGILAGLTFTLKQTSGLLICIALLGNKLLFVRTKEELKIYCKTFLYRLLGMFIPIISMLTYLIWNHAFDDFISYTIKGTLGFSNSISYRTLINFDIVGMLAILVPITILFTWYKCVIKEKIKVRYYLLVYGIAIFVIAFPISNEIHFLIGAMPIIILILYQLYSILQILYNKYLKNKHAFINKLLLFGMYFVTIFVILLTVFYSIKNGKYYLSLHTRYTNLEHYRYIPVKKGLEKEIKQIDQYILASKQKVIILDATAAIYMIPLNQYNKNYDMLLKGNLGFEGDTKMIEEISQAKNIKYLVLKDKFRPNWQTPLNVIDFVKDNKSKIGEIEIFDIYQ